MNAFLSIPRSHFCLGDGIAGMVWFVPFYDGQQAYHIGPRLTGRKRVKALIVSELGTNFQVPKWVTPTAAILICIVVFLWVGRAMLYLFFHRPSKFDYSTCLDPSVQHQC